MIILLKTNQMKTPINKDNFFIQTKASFRRVFHTPAKDPDHISYQTVIVWEKDLIDIDDAPEGRQAIVKLSFDEDMKVVGTQKFLFTYAAQIVRLPVLDEFENDIHGKGYKLQYTKPSSMYWFTEEGVYRHSDHWRRCKNCMWYLYSNHPVEENEIVTAFATWDSFKKIDPETFDYEN